MNAPLLHPLTSADIAKQVDEFEKLRRARDVKLIADRHRAVLASAEASTDNRETLYMAAYLRRHTDQLERFQDLGMLGANGIAPAVADVAKAAAFHGFKRRAQA